MNAFVNNLAAWVADYYLLATLLLVVSLLARLALRQPARRIAVAWGSVVALPILALLLMLPGWSVIHLLGRSDSPVEIAEVAIEPVVQPAPMSPAQPSFPVEFNQAPAPLSEFPLSQPAEIVPHTPPPMPEPAKVSEWPIKEMVATTFLAGTTIALAWCLMGAWQLRRLVRRSTLARAELAELLISLGDGQPVPNLRLSDQLSTAVALGLRRPTILLPTHLTGQHDPAALRTVLAHELAHVRNGDLWLVAALRAVMLLLWAHPLYWLARRGVRLDQELLADAAAAELTSRDTYAEQLVGWARELPASRGLALAGAVGLWETGSQLRQRIKLLLDERLTIVRSCSRRWKLAAMGLCAVAGIGLSLVTLQPRETLADEPVRTADEEEQASEKAPEKVADYSHLKSLEVRVVDPEGNPVEGAEVTPWALHTSLGHLSWGTPDNPEEAPTVATDKRGVATISYPDYYYGDGAESLVTSVTCRVTHAGFVNVPSHDVKVPQTSPATITLTRGAIVRLVGIVNDQSIPPAELRALWSSTTFKGKPAPDDQGNLVLPPLAAGPELIRLVRLSESGPALVSRVIKADLLEGGEYYLNADLYPTVNIRGRLSDDVPRPIHSGWVMGEIVTPVEGEANENLSWRTYAPVAEDGTFELSNLPAGEPLQIIAGCDGFAAASGLPPGFVPIDEWQRPGALNQPQTFVLGETTTEVTIEMQPTATFEVRVVDLAGEPVEGVNVAASPNVKWWGSGSQIYGEYRYDMIELLKHGRPTNLSKQLKLYQATTDATGVATIRNAPVSGRAREHLDLFSSDKPSVPLGSPHGYEIAARQGETTRTTITIDRSKLPAPEETQPDTSNTSPAGEWPATLSGEIKNDQDQPIAGATVKLAIERRVEYPIGWAQERLSTFEATTDDEGRYQFDTTGWPAIGTHSFVLLNQSVTAEGYVDNGALHHFTAGFEAGEFQLPQIRLSRGRMISGRVVDPSGQPVAGAVIRGSIRSSIDPPVTGADGRFQFTSRGGTTYWIYSSKHARTMLPVAIDATDLGDITLEEGTLIEGTVTTSEGVPVAGCVVVLEGGQHVENSIIRLPYTLATETDAEGKYQFVVSRSDYHPHYARGGYHIYVSHASLSMDRAEPFYVVGSVPPPLVAPQWIGVDGEEPTIRVDLKAREGVTLSGVVRWPDGTPAEAVEIRASDLPSPGNGVPFQGSGISLGRVTSDKEGAYRLTVPSGIKSIVLHGGPTRSSSGTSMMAQPAIEIEGGRVQGSFLQLRDEPLNENLEGLDWVLREEEIQPPTPRVQPSRNRSESSPPVEWPATLSGEIKNDQDKPIAGANVKLTLQQIHEYAIGRWDETLETMEGVTDEEGHYKFDLSTWPELRHPPFVITVSAGAEGHSNGRTWSWYDSSDKKVGDKFQELMLPAGRTVTGKVVDPDGKPVFGAVIHTVVDYGTNMMHNPRTSGPDGKFELRLSREGGAQVWICSAAGAPKFLAITKEQTDLGTIELERGTALEGTVRDAAGGPVAGCVVVMSSGYDGEMQGRSIAVQYATKTDGEGHYRLPPATGGYKVYLSMAERTSDRPARSFIVGDREPPAVIPQWHVLSGKEATKQADFTGTETVELGGTIRWRDGSPAAGVEVKASYLPDPSDVESFDTGIWIGRALTGADGTYTLKLPKGITAITLNCFGGRDKEGKWQTAFVADDVEGVRQAEQFMELQELTLDENRDDLDWVVGKD